jgi:Flp pilus assembly protein TadB
VFRRRSTTERSDELDATTSPTETVNGSRAAGKGKPTPTRKEAEQARKERVRPALTRRESVRRQREHVRSERGRARKAMMAGDERYLPPRDKGPERRFVRDYVDSRRTLAEFFLPTILIVLVLSLIRSPQIQLLSTLLWLGTLVLVMIDLAVIAVRVKRQVRQRFPDDQRRHVFYAIARATQMRRLRLPKPTVKPGTPV